MERDFRADMIEQFYGGAWYLPVGQSLPVGQDLLQPVRDWLLAVYGATLFAAVATALVGFFGGG